MNFFSVLLRMMAIKDMYINIGNIAHIFAILFAHISNLIKKFSYIHRLINLYKKDKTFERTLTYNLQ